ncbi:MULTISPECIES: OmpA family protein [unclassified Wenzhouxiangella]|uniref:OmpA family protein n=1 Tax=unclassified Wenzhouxiangella TaxID=2613841 RepID=UPI000E32B5D3|nr:MULTISPECIES: OmpA family protein [unclassified Wenzhouxiangella]RFF26986.1 hypothetical protein DZK25_10310 [Wenzhouxiangella sp. 15181]RFP69498.1 hypothetical protein DZK26_03800 [Wenzhouxiangella sp. 15190]
MKTPETRILLIPLSFVFLIGLTQGVNIAHADDIEGSEDHPLISRYDDSVITYYDVKDFGEYKLPLGELDDDRELSDSKTVTGKVTRIQYKAPEGRSTLEIYRNYETALKDAGFDILFSGTQGELGWFWTIKLYQRDVNPLDIEQNPVVSQQDFRYLSAKLDRQDEGAGVVYVSLCVSLREGSDSSGIQVDVVETGSMDTDKVDVRTDADVLAEEISSKGVTSIQDLYFDTGKASIKSESRTALEEISKFLKEEKGFDLYVVGHTDSSGDLEYNMSLSKDRAKAVVNALVTDYGISQERLHPHGVGPLAPTATNATEEGRAQNRRVELVKP